MSEAGSTLGDIVASNARRYPEQVAYRDADVELTHAALHHRAVKLASAMAAVGLRRQDCVALIGRNGVRFGEVLAACQLSGIIAATPNWRWSSTELAEAVRRVSPRMVFCDEEYFPLVAEVTVTMSEPGRARPRSVRTVVCSAAPITLQLLRRARSALPNANFANLYGQTEGIVSGLQPELHTVETADALGSVGFPFVGASVRIVDDDGSEVVPGRAGEIAVRADTLFRGYWIDDVARLAVLRDGWYHTGDVGRIDERGLLFLVDRKKDVIITGGENVYSPEVEEAVGAHEAVAECAVVGVADERWGEAVAAVVVLRAGSSVTLPDLQELASKTLARFKLPKRLVIVDDMPRLNSGKVDKKRLRADLATSG